MPCKTKKKPKGDGDSKWYRAGQRLNWSKDDGQTTRRANALKSRRGNYLKAARALQALANVTRDEETARKAKADARYFYMKYQKEKKGVEAQYIRR